MTVNDAAIDNNDGTRLTTISAIVTDGEGNTVEDGTPVSFTVVFDFATPPTIGVTASGHPDQSIVAVKVTDASVFGQTATDNASRPTRRPCATTSRNPFAP